MFLFLSGICYITETAPFYHYFYTGLFLIESVASVYFRICSGKKRTAAEISVTFRNVIEHGTTLHYYTTFMQLQNEVYTFEIMLDSVFIYL